jgi:hypothetical protein
VIIKGKMGEPVCQVSVDVNKMGMILLGGLNPVAAAREAGAEETNLPMSTVMEYKDLRRFSSVYREYLG